MQTAWNPTLNCEYACTETQVRVHKSRVQHLLYSHFQFSLLAVIVTFVPLYSQFMYPQLFCVRAISVLAVVVLCTSGRAVLCTRSGRWTRNYYTRSNCRPAHTFIVLINSLSVLRIMSIVCFYTKLYLSSEFRRLTNLTSGVRFWTKENIALLNELWKRTTIAWLGYEEIK